MKKFIVALMVIFLSACTLGKAVTPRQKVSEFLDKYKNQNTDVISQLDETIKTDIVAIIEAFDKENFLKINL